MVTHKKTDETRANPFTPLNLALKNFVGRQNILKAFKSELYKITNRRHWLIMGEGGVGKTSLLTHLWKLTLEIQGNVRLDEVPIENIAFIDIGFLDNPYRIMEGIAAALPDPADWKERLRTDIFSYFGVSSTGADLDLRRTIIASIIESSLSVFPPNPPELYKAIRKKTVPEPRSIEEGWLRLEAKLRPAMDTYPAPAVIFLDQVDKLSDWLLPREQAIFLRHLRIVLEMTAGSNIWFIMTARPERKGKLDHIEPLLFDSRWVDQTKTLHPFSPIEARYVITEPLRKMGLEWPQEAVETIVSTSEYLPYNLQLSGSLVWDYLESRNLLDESKTSLSAQDVHDIILEKNKELWHRFTDTQQVILKIITLAAPITEADILKRASTEGVTEGVRDILSSLRDSSFRPIRFVTIENSSDKYYAISHELFKNYIKTGVCGEEELDVTSIDLQLKAAPRLYKRHGELLSRSILDSAWNYRSQLQLSGEVLDILVLSEATNYSPEAYHWISYAGAQAVRTLIEALNSRNVSLKLGTIAALGALRASEAVAPLLDLLTEDPFLLIGFSPDNRSLIMDTVEWELGFRGNAARALSEIGLPAVDGLIKLLESNSERTRWLAVIALGGIDEPQVIDHLKTALNDKSIRVRQVAAKALKMKRDAGLHKLTLLPDVEFTDRILKSRGMSVDDVEIIGRISGNWHVGRTGLIAQGPSKSTLFLNDKLNTITEISCDVTLFDPTPADHWKAGIYLGASDVSDKPQKETPLYVFHGDQSGFYEYSPSSRAGRWIQTELKPQPAKKCTSNLMIRASGANVEYFYNSNLVSVFNDNFGFLHAAGISAWVDDEQPFKVEFSNVKVAWSPLSPFLVYANDFEGDTLSEDWRLWYGRGHKQPNPPSLCQVCSSQLKLSGLKKHFDYKHPIPTFGPKDKLGWAYRNFNELIRDNSLYEVRCWVRASKGATCRFLLWVHDNIDDQGSTFELKSPYMPFTPTTDWEEVKLPFAGSNKHGIRIHLVYAAGKGEIYIDRVELWVTGER